jgi:hypothetical protein
MRLTARNAHGFHRLLIAQRTPPHLRERRRPREYTRQTRAPHIHSSLERIVNLNPMVSQELLYKKPE